MKKFYAFLVCAALIGALVFGPTQQAHTSATVPLAGKTGAPSEGTCANSGCHTNSAGGTGNMVLDFGGTNAYVPGVTYTVTIEVNDATASRFGFELTALDDANNQAGTITVTNTANTAKPTSGGVSGREYISHKNANANHVWSFDWTAPATSVGDVTFYYSGNGANGNNNTAGDHIYTGSSVISVNTAVAASGNNDALFHVSSLSTKALEIIYTLPNPADVTIELYDAAGRKVTDLERTQAPAGNQTLVKTLDAAVTPGLYFVRFEAGDHVQTSKVFVL